jgi:hypothetical protein
MAEVIFTFFYFFFLNPLAPTAPETARKKGTFLEKF